MGFWRRRQRTARKGGWTPSTVTHAAIGSDEDESANTFHFDNVAKKYAVEKYNVKECRGPLSAAEIVCITIDGVQPHTKAARRRWLNKL